MKLDASAWAMGMSAAYAGAGSDDAESIRTIHRAIHLGVTLIDTSEVYGPYLNKEAAAATAEHVAVGAAELTASLFSPAPQSSLTGPVTTMRRFSVDKFIFGITADYDTAPDIDALAAGIANGVAQLVKSGRTRRRKQARVEATSA